MNNAVIQVPSDPEVEKAVLGCLLASDEGRNCLSDVEPGLFLSEPHRSIFAVISELHLDGKPVDMIPVTGLLRDRGLLAKVGGAAYVTDLQTTFGVPLSVARYCVGTLRQKAAKRGLIQLGEEMAKAATDGSQAEALLDDCQERLATLASSLDSGASGGLPPIIDMAKQIRQPPQKPPEVINGILHRGSKLVLGGSSKSFKTWTLIGLGIAVANGSPWLGYATKKGSVLYINAEVQEAFFVLRVQAVCSALDLELATDEMDVLHLRGHCADLAQLRRKIVQRIGAKEYDLIILDPIYKLMAGRDENKAGDIAAVLGEVERLATETGAAVAFGAHYSKCNQAAKEAIDRISSSGVFARDPDAILNLTRHEEENAFIVEATLRNCPPAQPFVVRWDYPLMRRDEELDPTRLKQQPRGGRSKKKPSLSEYLGLFSDTWNLEPTEAARGAAELRALFREKGWDEKCEIALRERAIRELSLDLVQSAHNRHLIGVPKVIAAIRRAGIKDVEAAKKQKLKRPNGGKRKEKGAGKSSLRACERKQRKLKTRTVPVSLRAPLGAQTETAFREN